MAQTSHPFRDDGKYRLPPRFSQREKYVIAVLCERFGIKNNDEPLHWIAVQAEADQPDMPNWRRLWNMNSRPLGLNNAEQYIQLLRYFGERVVSPVLRGQDSVTDLLTTLLDSDDVELYDAEDGCYLVVPQPEKLLKLHRGSVSNTATCNVYASSEFTPEEYWGLLTATVFRAWQGEDQHKVTEARALFCQPYAKAIADAAHEAEEEYGRVTILGTWSPAGHHSEDIQKVNHVVVWTEDKGELEAWLFDGSRFTPDSFHDPEPTRMPRSASKVDAILYGTTGLIFKTRVLVTLLRDVRHYYEGLWIMPCRMSVIGEFPQADEDILFVRQSRLKQPMPQGGKKLL